MAEYKKIKSKLINATYVKEAKSVLLLLECEHGRFHSQIHRDQIATFKNKTETEIEKEMEKYVDILKHIYLGKDRVINSVFDTEIEDKIKDHFPVKY